MFSVYGISGPIFSGSLEDLTRVRPLHSLRAVQPIGEEGEAPSFAGLVRQPGAEAIRAYQDMIHNDQERGPLYRAEQVMQRRVITVAASDDVAQAWRTLQENHIHQAPVLDDAARLIGVVSERNLLTALNIEAERIIESLGRQVRDVMTTPVVATEPLTDIRLIATVMLDHDVDGVPIVDDNGRLIGFVSRSDILRAVVNDPPLSLWR
ncbi:MAG: CBS domain-containing protein [Rhodocyclaceae bacterium]|jgi:CBS-domain-containing membrane protein|nr:CBS domain-containing protein [Rhodocyclaceae bacterium]